MPWMRALKSSCVVILQRISDPITFHMHPLCIPIMLIRSKSIQQLVCDENEARVSLTFLLSPAFAGCRSWLVDLGQQHTKAAAAGTKTFSFEYKRYVEVKNHMHLEPKDPTDFFAASAFIFIWEIRKKLPNMLWMEKVGVLTVE